MKPLCVFPAEEYDISGNEYTHVCVLCGATTADHEDGENELSCLMTWGPHRWVAK